MGTHRITREHEICFGHRVCGHEGKCRDLHGHNYVFRLTCESPSNVLDEVGRIIDFSVIKSKVCEWLEVEWDHKMVLWEDDPIVPQLRDIGVTVATVRLNPTAENLALMMVDDIAPKLLVGTGARLVQCVVQETGKCSASYEACRR